MVRLFNEIEREDDDGIRHNEPEYSYLDRSGRKVAQAIRELLETWFLNYPDKEKKQLARRFTSRNNEQHYSAFFELFLHEMFKRLGCKLDIETDFENTSNHPDFLIRTPDGLSFILEATIATGKSDKEIAADKIRYDLMDFIDRIESPYFFVDLEYHGRAASHASMKNVKKSILQWLDSLDPDNPAFEDYEKRDSMKLVLEYSGLEINFTATPKKAARGKPDVGMSLSYSPKLFQPVSMAEDLRKSLYKKCKKYGKHDIPYLIAVDLIGGLAHLGIDDEGFRIEILDALFGDECYLPAGNKMISKRNENGFFVGKDGRKNINVSGVVICQNLTPWTLSSSGIRIFNHPWAELEIASENFFDAFFPVKPEWDENKMFELRYAKNKHIGSYFDLSDDWPRSL